MKHVIGDCTLYHGDAIKILPTLEQVDLVLTDPPYKLISGGNSTGEMGGCFSKENYDNSGSIVPCDIDWCDFMPLLYNVLKDGCHAYIMANNRNVMPMLLEAEEAYFSFHNLLVWDKGTATPNRWYMKNCEFIGFFYKTRTKYINDCGAKQLINCPQTDNVDHPTPKPVALMQNYIEQSTSVGDTVIDPFFGSASTAIACIRSGRKFIGIEKDEKYFNLGVDRIKKELKNIQKSMF